MPGTLRAVSAKRIKLNLLQGFIGLAHVKRSSSKCDRCIYDEPGLQRLRVLIGLSRNYNLPISRTNVFAGLTAFSNHAAIMSIAVPYSLSHA